jgi:tubulin polyglutamylase TTLL4
MLAGWLEAQGKDYNLFWGGCVDTKFLQGFGEH